ncbi:MAG: amino acid carrier protein [Candidatus Midichloria sp.]|nr:MAG: amino acid carrier protein [Candidatus Midichloria sp.]
MHHFFSFLELLDNLLWNYLALAIILFSGLYFTIKSQFYQVRVILNVKKHFKSLIADADKNKAGVHPIKLYFASLGGMVGIGNLVAVMSAVTIGGPGSLIWLWIASFMGMIVKYSEIYLGIKHRKSNYKNGYDGGPMYYLEKAFGNKVIPIIFCLLFCVYGAEVSQFLIITDTFTTIFNINRLVVIFTFLGLVLLSALGGVKRLANICSVLLPPFLAVYVLIAIYIFVLNLEKLPTLLLSIITSAFTNHASIGGFVGSTVLLSAHYGVSRAVYSGDIGIGYDATVLSESQTEYPEKQARMAIFALFADTMLCTISVMIVLLTGVWNITNIKLSEYIVLGLSTVMPYAEIFMSIVFFIAGFTTITGYLVVGQKCAKFINKKYGHIFYILYAIAAFILFSFHEQLMVMLIMSVSGGLLLILNLLGLFKLRNQVKFPKSD